MPLNIHNTLKMVEEEIISMKKRQQFVVGTYQQQTREDIFRKFIDAENELLSKAEEKIKEFDIEENNIYLIKSNRKESTISVRRISDERSLIVEIDPIIYPTPFNLKFILNEPSVTLYSPSMNKGIISLNSNTVIRAIDTLTIIDQNDLKDYLELWIEPASKSFKDKLSKVMSKIGSNEFLIEGLLALSKDPPNRELISLCYDHELKGYHEHGKIIDVNIIKSMIIKHLKLDLKI
ncbi:MAG: hypothetical protein QW416_00475 [Candidatus Nitrosocaldaceae archaeon]